MTETILQPEWDRTKDSPAIILPVPHFAVLAVHGYAFKYWNTLPIPVDLRDPERIQHDGPVEQPLPLTHFWPVYGDINDPEQREATGLTALVTAGKLSAQYNAARYQHPVIGTVGLEPTRADVYHVHPSMLALPLGDIAARCTPVQYRLNDYDAARASSV